MGEDIVSTTEGDDFMSIHPLGNIIVGRVESEQTTYIRKYDESSNSWKELGDTSSMDAIHAITERFSIDGTKISILKHNGGGTNHFIEIWEYDEFPHDPASTPTPTNIDDFEGTWTLEKTISQVNPGYELDGNDLKIMALNQNFSPFAFTFKSSLNIEDETGAYSQIGNDIEDGNARLHFSNNQDNTPTVLAFNADFFNQLKGELHVYEYNSSENEWVKSPCDFAGEKTNEWFGYGDFNDKRSILGTQSWENVSVITYKSNWRDEIILNSALNKTYDIDSSFTGGTNAHFKLEGEHRLEPIYSSGTFSKTTPHIVIKVGDTLNMKNLTGFGQKLCIKDVPTLGETSNLTSGVSPQLVSEGETMSFTPSEKGVYFYMNPFLNSSPFSVGKILVI
jgi:hypothetical protein